MVSVAQLVEPRIVIPVVVGSSPIVHPIFGIVPARQHRPGIRVKAGTVEKNKQSVDNPIRSRRTKKTGVLSGGGMALAG